MKDLVNKPMKSDALKIKQSFKTKVTFPCFGIRVPNPNGIVSVCSTVCLLLLLFLFDIQLVSVVCGDSVTTASGLGASVHPSCLGSLS